MMTQLPPRPMEGLRILDASTILGGPITATILADFGAEVIKVEMPGKGDSIREGPSPDSGPSYVWLQEGRNKRSITLDLHHHEAQELFKRLVALSDGVVENFRPGTLERWNVGPEELLEVNPGLVMLRLSGYGQTGPYRHKGAFDRIASAFGGVHYVTGYPDAPPVRAGYALADYMAAYVGAFAMAMALYWRDAKGGRGQVIDLALYEPILRASEGSIPYYHRTGYIRERNGNTNPFIVPSSCFPTADDKWVVLSANTHRLWVRLANAIGKPELLNDERFATLEARCAHADELNAILEGWTARRTAAEVVGTLEEAQLPACTVNSIADIFADPHVKARENIVYFDDPRFGELAMPGVIPKLSDTPGRIDRLGPDLGDSNNEIYGGLLGLSEEEMDALRGQGVI